MDLIIFKRWFPGLNRSPSSLIHRLNAELFSKKMQLFDINTNEAMVPTFIPCNY